MNNAKLNKLSPKSKKLIVLDEGVGLGLVILWREKLDRGDWPPRGGG